MHPYDAKVNIFSEMDVPRVAQSKSPGAAEFHVTLVCHVWALVTVSLLLLFCLDRMLTFAIACV